MEETLELVDQGNFEQTDEVQEKAIEFTIVGKETDKQTNILPN